MPRVFALLALLVGCPATGDSAPDSAPDCAKTDPAYTDWYADLDGDGWGDPTTPRGGCDSRAGEVPTGDDCDDTDPEIHPEATDACDDGVDENCDGRDPRCSLNGEVSMAEADAKVYAEANFMMGEYLDVGDVNGDGFQDIAATTMYADGMQGGAGVVFGPITGPLALSDAGARLTSSRSTTSAGRSIAVGDVNGDTIADVAVGAPDETGMEWVVFGPITADIALADADVIRTGPYDTEVGHGGDLADVTGDGIVDLLVGAYENDAYGLDAGVVYVEHGPVTPGESTIEGEADQHLYGESAGAYAGRYVCAGGDVDGDGIGDMLIAAPYASDGAPASGAAYLVYGGGVGDLKLTDADAKYAGEGASDYAGEALALGDVSGDGLSDVLLGSYNMASGNYTGATYVVFGPATQTSGLGEAEIVLRGDQPGQQFGLALSGKDIDGDGVGDLLIGARGDSSGAKNGGGAWLYFGPVAASLDIAAPDVHFLADTRGSATGAAVDVGDLDADGVGDVIIGAPNDRDGGNSAGAVYVVYGGG